MVHTGMVSNIHATLDDQEAERVKAVKDELGLTWAEYLTEAADVLEERAGDSE